MGAVKCTLFARTFRLKLESVKAEIGRWAKSLGRARGSGEKIDETAASWRRATDSVGCNRWRLVRCSASRRHHDFIRRFDLFRGLYASLSTFRQGRQARLFDLRGEILGPYARSPARALDRIDRKERIQRCDAAESIAFRPSSAECGHCKVKHAAVHGLGHFQIRHRDPAGAANGLPSSRR